MAVPMVLVHGLRTSASMWRAQTEALDRLGIEHRAVDLPGHGTRRGERFTLDAGVEAIRAGVERCGSRALVVGLSLGGYLAIAHAARYPGQVAGLIAASCCTVPRRVLVDPWRAASWLIGQLPDRGAGMNAASVALALPPAGAADVAAGGFALEVMGDVLTAMQTADPLGDLRSVRAPVWLVNGRFDHFRGDERAFLRACREGTLVVVPGATHLVSLVAPVAFTRVLLEVQAQVSAAAAAQVLQGAAEAGVEPGR